MNTFIVKHFENYEEDIQKHEGFLSFSQSLENVAAQLEDPIEFFHDLGDMLFLASEKMQPMADMEYIQDWTKNYPTFSEAFAFVLEHNSPRQEPWINFSTQLNENLVSFIENEFKIIPSLGPFGKFPGEERMAVEYISKILKETERNKTQGISR